VCCVSRRAALPSVRVTNKEIDHEVDHRRAGPGPASRAVLQSNTVNALRRHPLTVFFVLALGATWAVWIPRAAGVPMGIIAELSTWIVALAAVLAAALTGGRDAVKDLGARLLRWRVGLRWYVLVILGPAAFALTSAGVFLALGGTWSQAVPGFLTGNLAFLPLFILLAALTDGLGEEVGWRGFALPRLLVHHTPWLATLILAGLWALWHAPLLWTQGRVLYGQPWWLFVLDIAAKAIIFSWVFLRTRGSLLIAVLLHATSNVFGVSPAVSATGSLSLPMIAVGLEWVLAMIVLTRARPSFFQPVTDPELVYPGPSVTAKSVRAM